MPMLKKPIVFGEWAPDLSELDGQFSSIAENVYPAPNSYLPVGDLAAVTTTALSGSVVGLTFARTAGGTFVIFAGTTTKLWKYSAGSWSDVTRASGGAYNATNWSFAQSGTKLVAVNVNDDPQVIDIDGGTAFAALGGSPPRAVHVRQMGDFLVLSGLASNRRKIQWSAINDITGWTVGTNLSDEQEFPDGGLVMGVAGGENGFVMQDRAIRSMQFLAGDTDTIFSFTRIEDKKGALSTQGFVSINQTVYFLGEDGFFAMGPQGLLPIGANKINEWFIANSDTARRGAVVAFSVANKPRVCFAFHNSPGSVTYDRLLIFDWSLNRWSYAVVSAQWWATLASPGIDLDTDIDTDDSLLDSDAASLDSYLYVGGRPIIGAIDTQGYLAFLSGANLAARIETVESHLIPGQRTFVNGVYPLLDAEGVTVAAGTRERLQDTLIYDSPAALEITGSCSVLSSGRLHRFRVEAPAGAMWTHAQGVLVDAQPDGDV